MFAASLSSSSSSFALLLSTTFFAILLLLRPLFPVCLSVKKETTLRIEEMEERVSHCFVQGLHRLSTLM